MFTAEEITAAIKAANRMPKDKGNRWVTVCIDNEDAVECSLAKRLRYG